MPMLSQIPIQFLIISMNLLEWLLTGLSVSQSEANLEKYMEIITHATMDFSQ